MDFISLFLSLFGLNRDRLQRRTDQRNEVARLNAEVAGEAGRALDIIVAAMPRLTRRCAQVCGDNPEICESMLKVLNEQRDAALKLMAMAEGYKKQIADVSGNVDWDNAIPQFQEWRVTASRIPPWVENIINRYDAIFYEAGAR
jgi:hypothetical protein